MKINRKIKALFIEFGEVNKELPEDLEKWILNKYVTSNGCDCSGSAFSSLDTFIVWVDLDSENDAKEQVDLSDLEITKEIYKEKNLEKNWVVFNYSISINRTVVSEI